MFQKSVLLASALLGAASAQQVGTLQTENHPKITTYKCTKAGGCTSQAQSVTIDANWRWTHVTTGYTNCYTGNAWNTTACPDGKTCAQNCALEGADYPGTYGITTSGDALTLKFVTQGTSGANIGSRVYLMASDSAYQMFNLKNQEFSFDVDTSNLPCGLNGALYLVEMDADGGMAKNTGNKAGAKYGTGYCDTQCPHDIKFINGEANVLDWTPSTTDKNAGAGRYGACCNEMDIWEANSISAAYTPHVCSNTGLLRCEGATQCGDGDQRYAGVCDKDGCDFNSYRMGDTSFYGPSKKIDTTKKFTVVTQFITSDGTSSGKLIEIKRKYVQNNVVIENSISNIAGITAGNSITDSFCTNQKTVFGDTNTFNKLGGVGAMGDSLARGMVLALSVWDDHAAHMLWLDSTYPTDSTKPGAARGTCATTSGDPKDVEVSAASASVTYSNIRWGDLDSTYTGGSTNPPSGSSTLITRTSTSSAPPSGSTGVAKYGQCGGIGYNGPTTCVASTCTKINDWYSQCL